MSSQNTVLRSGWTVVISFQSYCVLVHSYLRNGQRESHHITSNDCRDIVFSTWNCYPNFDQKIQVTVFWPDTADDHVTFSDCGVQRWCWRCGKCLPSRVIHSLFLRLSTASRCHCARLSTTGNSQLHSRTRPRQRTAWSCTTFTPNVWLFICICLCNRTCFL